MAITSYNAKDCAITWDNTTITGLGEDMVTGEKDEEFFEPAVGAQGDVVVNEKNDPLGTVTLTLQATSPHYNRLIADAKAGKIAPLWIKNKSLNRSFGGNSARIKNYPEQDLRNEASDGEFEFAVFDYTVQ